jgi:3-oxoacyl-[acyl-carrier protein] reductase
MAGAPRKLAIVTGAAKGLGRHLCWQLAGAGYDILVNYLSSETRARKLVAGLGELGATAWKHRADVGRADEVAALFEAADNTGRELGLVINNVGIYNPIPLRQIDGAQWERTIASNLNGAFHVCHQALKRLRSGGQIVNIGVAGNQLSQAEGFALTRALAVEYAPDRIRLNMVSPGQLANSIGEVGGTPGQVPIGRDGSFDDVWQAVEYLLAADYVTGANIEVAGGYRL